MPFRNQLGGYVIQQVELTGSGASPIYSPIRGLISQSWIEKREMVKLSLKAAKSGERGKRQGRLSIVSKTLPEL